MARKRRIGIFYAYSPFTGSSAQDLAEVKVYREDHSGEFVCRLSVNGKDKPKADYFTDDKQDAFGTAQDMANRAINGLVK